MDNENEAQRLAEIRGRATAVDADGFNDHYRLNAEGVLFLLSILDRHKENLLAATDRVVELEGAMRNACGLIYNTSYFRSASDITEEHSRAIQTILDRAIEQGKQAETLRYDRDQLEEKVERLEGQIGEHESIEGSLYILALKFNTAPAAKDAAEALRQIRHSLERQAHELMDCILENDKLKAEQERRAADVRPLVAVVIEAIDEIDPRYSLGTVLESKLNEAMAKINEWLPK